MQTTTKNFLKIPSAAPRLWGNLLKLKQLHEKVSKRRDEAAPFAYLTYDHTKNSLTWNHVAHTWVDEELPLSRKEFNEYVWYQKDFQKTLPALAIPILGPVLGTLAFAGWLSKDGWVPSAFSEKKNIYEIKLEWYEKYGDEIRQKMGPMLQHHLQRLFRGCMNTEHLFLPDELVESYKETFYSHYLAKQRDVRKAAHLQFFDEPAVKLLMTNKDPVEITPELQLKFQEINQTNISAAEKKAKKLDLLRHEYEHQTLHGRTIDHIPSLELPADSLLLGENASEGKDTEDPETVIPLESLDFNGDLVYIPNDHRTGMENWTSNLQKIANEFLLTPWRFSPASWNQRRLVTWYEQVLQDDQLIIKEGGIQKLSDLELKVALLDRAILRVDEDLTRGDMEARWKEFNWLLNQRTSLAVVLSWQTGFFRTTYSPEDDLPEPSILPKYNRSMLDVDTHNALKPDRISQPSPYLHPALYPGGLVA